MDNLLVLVVFLIGFIVALLISAAIVEIFFDKDDF